MTDTLIYWQDGKKPRDKNMLAIARKKLNDLRSNKFVYLFSKEAVNYLKAVLKNGDKISIKNEDGIYCVRLVEVE